MMNRMIDQIQQFPVRVALELHGFRLQTGDFRHDGSNQQLRIRV